MNVIKVTLYLDFSATPTATIFAAAPTIVAFAPRQTERESPHHIRCCNSTDLLNAGTELRKTPRIATIAAV